MCGRYGKALSPSSLIIEFLNGLWGSEAGWPTDVQIEDVETGVWTLVDLSHDRADTSHLIEFRLKL